MQCTFFSDVHWKQLYPFAFPYQKGKLRWGAFTLEQYWHFAVIDLTSKNKHVSRSNVQTCLTQGSLNDRWIPNEAAIVALTKLKPGQTLISDDVVLYTPSAANDQLEQLHFNDAFLVNHPTDFFTHCGLAMESQSRLIQKQWETKTWDAASEKSNTTIIGDPDLVFMAPGSSVRASTMNTEHGPIFIGPNAEIQEGSNIRGPFLLDEESIVKMGTRIYGPTLIGPHCRIAGEISNSVFLGFSNKGHDGFLGNSVIGQWCNLGADTNTSNLKNNYSPVRLWDTRSASMKTTELQFCGLIMGDHSKCGINTMFNTGTLIGSGCMLVGGSFMPKHVLPFSWGGDGKWTEHRFDQFVATAKTVMERRQQQWDPEEEQKWKREFTTAHAMRIEQT